VTPSPQAPRNWKPSERVIPASGLDHIHAFVSQTFQGRSEIMLQTRRELALNLAAFAAAIPVFRVDAASADVTVQGYMINLESMNASKIRSKFKDTDIVSLTVSVNGVVTGNITKDLGDVGSGNHGIGMFLPAIAPADGSVQFSYQIVNSGFNRSTESSVKGAMGKLSDAAAKVCTGVFGYKNVWDAANKFTHWLNDIMFIDCDGVVAGDAFSFPVNTLQSVAAQGRHTGRYPGSDSAVGCGGNSLYFVDWSLRPMSAQEISNITAQAPSQDNWQWCNKCQGLAPMQAIPQWAPVRLAANTITRAAATTGSYLLPP
jgi:hypothetical protein